MDWEELKRKGDAAYKADDMANAISWYTQAIELCGPEDVHVIYSNRSAANLRLEDANAALLDAIKCVELEPTWAKGYSRKGLALLRLSKPKEAEVAYMSGLEVDPTNEELRKGLREARKPATSSSSGSARQGSWLTRLREYIASSKVIALQSALRFFLLLNGLLFLLPLGSLSNVSYRRMLLMALLLNGLSIYGSVGGIKLTKEYMVAVAQNAETQQLFMVLLFLSQRPYVVAALPILLSALVQFLWYVTAVLQHARPEALRPLDSIAEKYVPALFGIWDWSSRSVNQRFIGVKKHVDLWVAMLQVMFGVMLIVEIFLPRRNVLLLLLYWQIMRVRYMLDFAPGSEGHIHTAFKQLDIRILNLCSNARCPRAISSLYAKIKEKMASMVELPDASTAQQQAGPKCTIM